MRVAVVFEGRDNFLLLFGGNVAAVVVKNRFKCSERRGVKQNDRGHVFTKRRGDAREFLGKNPNADFRVAGRESEVNELAGAALNVFGRGAVVENDQGVEPPEDVPQNAQSVFDLVLFADNGPKPRIFCGKILVGLVLVESGANENNVVELSAERPPKLVKQKKTFS